MQRGALDANSFGVGLKTSVFVPALPHHQLPEQVCTSVLTHGMDVTSADKRGTTKHGAAAR